jgi:CDP-glucose 4,6-dehydratase
MALNTREPGTSVPDDHDAKPVSWIVDALTQNWGKGVQTGCVDANEQPHEAAYLKLDCTKAKQFLGWRPVVKLASSVELDCGMVPVS